MACCVILACIFGLILAIKTRVLNCKEPSSLARDWRLQTPLPPKKQD